MSSLYASLAHNWMLILLHTNQSDLFLPLKYLLTPSIDRTTAQKTLSTDKLLLTLQNRISSASILFVSKETSFFYIKRCVNVLYFFYYKHATSFEPFVERCLSSNRHSVRSENDRQ